MDTTIVSENKWGKRIFPIALSVCVVFLILYASLGFLGVTIPSGSQDSIGRVSGWCERVSSSIFREPVNALSNIGFMFAGLLMIRVLSRDQKSLRDRNQFHGFTPVAILYAGATIYLGIGSMLMHGTHTGWGGWADNQSMVMYILVPWLINLKEMGRWSLRRFLTVYTSIVLVYSLTRWIFGSKLGINLDVFDVSIALWIISEVLFKFWTPKMRWISGFFGFVVAAIFGIMPSDIFLDIDKHWWVILFWIPGVLSPNQPRIKRTYSPWAFGGIFSFLIAYMIWLQGYPDSYYCDPDSLIQPHAIWHLTTAFSTWCFFKFLRTDRDFNVTS
tara:strand:- start:3872 stop:4861 length:990 start_codon:yes stop_codon:yes gene_type:complete